MAERKPIDSWLTDMDGVLIHACVPITARTPSSSS